MDRVAELLSSIDRIHVALEAAEPGQVAALLREKRMTLAELDAIGPAKGSTIDELKSRREVRRSAAGASPAAGGRQVKRGR